VLGRRLLGVVAGNWEDESGLVPIRSHHRVPCRRAVKVAGASGTVRTASEPPPPQCGRSASWLRHLVRTSRVPRGNARSGLP
jgi:hypothetical protein